MSQQQWYALYTKPKAEYKVATALEQAGVEVFLPEIYIKEKQKAAMIPFFPCYLFISANLQELHVSVWKWTPGLRHIVAYGDQPIRLSPDIIRLIRSKIDQLNTKMSDSPTLKFEPGDAVRIMHDSLQDMEAIFEGPTTPSKRVYVLLTILERQYRIRVNAADIEKVSDPMRPPMKKRRRTRGRGRRIAY
ncbi:MAG: hypothetical protein GY805_11680 [Chloroflexi bacterium]|nr:hypothetical protein [Chloroflexota bacterium]